MFVFPNTVSTGLSVLLISVPHNVKSARYIAGAKYMAVEELTLYVT